MRDENELIRDEQSEGEMKSDSMKHNTSIDCDDVL